MCTHRSWEEGREEAASAAPRCCPVPSWEPRGGTGAEPPPRGHPSSSLPVVLVQRVSLGSPINPRGFFLCAFNQDELIESGFMYIP